MDHLKTRIKKLSLKYHQEIIAIRRQIHQNPELAFEENQTAAFVSQKLTKYGIGQEWHRQNRNCCSYRRKKSR